MISQQFLQYYNLLIDKKQQHKNMQKSLAPGYDGQL